MKYEMRIKRTREFVKRRAKVWDEVMIDFPEGLTKENHKEIVKRVKKKEREIKKEVK